jgi:hypothetical protein
MKYVKRSLEVVEAEQYLGVGSMVVKTPSGEVKAEPTDYIIDRGNGDRYPVKKEIFERLYEPFVESAPILEEKAEGEKSEEKK